MGLAAPAARARVLLRRRDELRDHATPAARRSTRFPRRLHGGRFRGAARLSSSPLEPDTASLRALIDAAVDRLLRYLESLPEQPAADVEGAEAVARALAAEIPEEGGAIEPLLDLLFERAIPKSFNAAGPGYLGYIPGGGIPQAAIGELLAAGVNRYTGVWQAAPALVQLETDVLRWFCGLAGYGPAARGFLTSGGSLANFSAVVAARRDRLPEDFLRGTIYTSDQVHHSVTKAAMLAGFPARNVRALPADESFRLPPARVAAAVAADRERGLQPFLLVASAGTVNTGAVDDLPGLADVAQREGLWLHVDGAYGGFFLLTERGRAAFAGIERADSLTLDPHKGLFVPYGTGCLLARDGATLSRAHSLHASYLPELPASDELWDFSTLSPELSRPFRGLPLWLALHLVGAAAFRQALDEKLDLARWAAAEIAALPGVRLLAPPELSLFAFRLEPAGIDRPGRDALNRRWLAATNAPQRVYLTGTELADGFALRLCVLSFRTHHDRVAMAVDDLRAALAKVAGET
jgi:aromatic-L-amino-acid decarboxylase